MEFSAETVRNAGLFAIAAIRVIQKTNKVNPKTSEPFRGAHVSWTKLGAKLRARFNLKPYPATDLNDLLTAIEATGAIVCTLGRGGMTAYLPADKPVGARTRSDERIIDDEIERQLAMLDADAILADEPTEENTSVTEAV